MNSKRNLRESLGWVVIVIIAFSVVELVARYAPWSLV